MEQRTVSFLGNGSSARTEVDPNATPRERRSTRSDGAELGSLVHRDLLAAVAHDLRNPLNAVTLSIAGVHEVCLMLRDEPAAERIERSLGIVEHAAQHMNRIIEELLDVASLEAEVEPLHKTPVEMAALIDDVLEMIGPVAESKRVSLRKRVGSSRIVVCDRPRMFRALSNLVGNAVKFTPSEGQVSVELEVLSDCVAVRVVDSGPGIAAEQQSKVFEPYWRAPHGVSGIGIGLYIARGIVAAHGGRMWVEAEARVGSAFCFTVPAADAKTP